MTAEADGDPRRASVDGALSTWRQGDCVVTEQWFAHRLNKSFPLTNAGQIAAEEDGDLAEDQVDGFVVLTQTCDIVRSCAERPYMEVCPLVEVEEQLLHDVERGRRPRYAFLPLLADRKLVADLDRVMTVEKAVVAAWTRTAGWVSEKDGRNFAQALARKRVRAAFPDDFTKFVRKLEARFTDKHQRDSPEGRGLRALREIRVQAAPSWDAQQVELLFWFVREDGAATPASNWADLLEGWRKLLPPSGRFSAVDTLVVTLGDMTAADYVDSDPLDLDHVSINAPAESDELHF